MGSRYHGSMTAQVGKLVVHRADGLKLASALVPASSGVSFALPGFEGLTFYFALGKVPEPPQPPPRELESMRTVEVAEYLRSRIQADAEERRWDSALADE
jgi:hypothetical protein